MSKMPPEDFARTDCQEYVRIVPLQVFPEDIETLVEIWTSLHFGVAFPHRRLCQVAAFEKCSAGKRIPQGFSKSGPHGFQVSPGPLPKREGKRVLQTHNALEAPQVVGDPVPDFVPDAGWYPRAAKCGHGSDGIIADRIIQIEINIRLCDQAVQEQQRRAPIREIGYPVVSRCNQYSPPLKFI